LPWRIFGCVGEYFWDRSGVKCAKGEIVGGVVASDGNWEEDGGLGNDDPDERDGNNEEADRPVNDEGSGEVVSGNGYS
jgi:hypothetical protein